LEWTLGNDIGQLATSAETSLALALEASDKLNIAIARYYLGLTICLSFEDEDQARALMEQSFTEFQALNQPFWQAQSFKLLGYLLMKQHKLSVHERLFGWLELARKAGERFILADALKGYANYLFRINRTDEALQHIAESDGLYKQLGSEKSNLNSLLFADIAWHKGNLRQARSIYIEVKERLSLLGETRYQSRCIADLGRLAMEEGDLRQAEDYLEQVLLLSRLRGFKPDIAVSLTELSNVYYLQGRLEEFKQNFRDSLALKTYLSDYTKTYVLMMILSSLYFQKPEGSARLLGAATRYENGQFQPLTPIEKRYGVRAEAHAREVLDDAVFKAAFLEGQNMSLDVALDLALKLVEEIE
jgi:tetratricopeptide (TPR) repeat protein